MNKHSRPFYVFLLALVLVSCSKVPLTGRKQFTMLPESMVMEMSLSSYQDFLKSNPPMRATNPAVTQVKTVGQNVSQAVVKYMNEHGYASRVKGYKWEFNAVDSKDVNAWCMPGGKVVVY